MKVCIAGGGRVGRYLAQSLLTNHHSVVIIEPIEAQCRMLADSLDIPVICGDSISVDTLRTADVGSCNAFVAMTCAYIFFTGTTTLMILGNIMAVPEEVREAAMLDGASGLRQDWYITIPMIKGTLKTVSVLAATSGFLLYNEVYFLTKGAAGTYLSLIHI